MEQGLLGCVPAGVGILDAEQEKTPYILVIGQREVKDQTVSVRKRGMKDQGVISVDKFIEKIKEEVKDKV